MSDYRYEGSELDTFAHARNWKSYVHARIRGSIGVNVLEVGAGIGANTAMLAAAVPKWTCLEPDPALVTRLNAMVAAGELPRQCRVVCGTLDILDPAERFDTLIYCDVLEHIADDAAEVRRAANRLVPGGRLIVLSPAHQWLFTPFDAAIGHHRRYSRASLAALTPPTLTIERLIYMDAIGMVASLGNKMVLRSAHPTLAQVLTWDRVMVPISRVIDTLLGYNVGKSVLAIWRRV